MIGASMLFIAFGSDDIIVIVGAVAAVASVIFLAGEVWREMLATRPGKRE